MQHVHVYGKKAKYWINEVHTEHMAEAMCWHHPHK